ncbi:ABC transporter permease [Candidatus Dependentiae bacterium]|nr:ABC transporter permease [Candidatus Dependentiae bacterium]
MVKEWITHIGEAVINTCNSVGIFTLFLIKSIRILFSKKLKVKKIIDQLEHIGVNSLPIVLLTGTFTGMVFALQSYIGFQRVGGEQFIGAVVALGMIRELGPVLTALMVTGRAGSAIAAEIGTMRITEQIDALQTLRINPVQYLVIPRILAGTLVLPFLSIFSTMIGIIGGYFICVNILELNGEDYINNIRTYVEMKDIIGGLIKASVFGFILTSVGSFKGFYTTGGARGVGLSTTQSVVVGSISILISNYFLTKLLEQV